MKIPEKLLQKYNVKTIDGDGLNAPQKSEEFIYKGFLDNTDYIILKIVEGVSTKEDYAEELNYRQIAREELDKIGGLV